MQIAEYIGDHRQRIVKHVGSARTPAELGVVMAQARQLLAEYERPGQGSLDLGVELEPEVGLIEVADDVGILEVPGLERAGPGGPVLVEPGQVVATASRLLFEVLAGVYDQLGFGGVGDDTFRDLVIARVAEPTARGRARSITPRTRRLEHGSWSSDLWMSRQHPSQQVHEPSTSHQAPHPFHHEP